MDPKPSECCEAWDHAFDAKTDSEGYASLLDIWVDGSVTIGCDLPPVRFCPWCGASKGKDA